MNSSPSSIATSTTYNSQDTLYKPYKLINLDEPNNNNIKPYVIQFYKRDSNRAFKTINVVTDNPFVKSGLRIVKNDIPQGYFFLDVPGNGMKQNLDKVFGPDVYDRIPKEKVFDKMFFSYNISELESKFIVISYKVDLDSEYDERGGSGYQVSYLEVYDSSGNQILQRKVDGGVHNKAILTNNGNYLTYFNVLDHREQSTIRTEFCILNTLNNRLVYKNVFNNLFLDRCYSYLDSGKNIVCSLITEIGQGDVICFFPEESLVYITSNKIEHLYTFHEISGDKVTVGFIDKPAQKFDLNKDFKKIKLNQ